MSGRGLNKVPLDIRRRFFKSPEEKKIFDELNISYENQMIDNWWDQFVRETRNSKIRKEINHMLRIIVDSDEQYIVHDLTFFGEDNIGNPKTFYKGQQGLIEVPLPTWRFKVGPEEDGFEDLKIKHTIPFSEKTADKLHELCTAKTQYSITKGAYETRGRRCTVQDFDSWKKGPADILLRFGKYPISDYEAKIMEDEKQGKFTYMSIPPAGATAVYR